MNYMQAPSGEVFTTTNPEWHKECKQLTQKAGKIARAEYARDQLRAMLKPGQKVYTTLRHVSKSGMMRRISLLIVVDGELRNIDNLAADAMGDVNTGNGIKATGCGMDMGFHLVYNLGYYLWPNGTPEPHGTRNGEPDRDGGYALKHDWA